MLDNICLHINLISTCPFMLHNHSYLIFSPWWLLIMFPYLLAHLTSLVNLIRNVKNYFFSICPKSQPSTKSSFTFIGSDFTSSIQKHNWLPLQWKEVIQHRHTDSKVGVNTAVTSHHWTLLAVLSCYWAVL